MTREPFKSGEHIVCNTDNLASVGVFRGNRYVVETDEQRDVISLRYLIGAWSASNFERLSDLERAAETDERPVDLGALRKGDEVWVRGEFVERYADELVIGYGEGYDEVRHYFPPSQIVRHIPRPLQEGDRVRAGERVGVLKTLGATLAGILCDDGEPALAPIKELRRA